MRRGLRCGACLGQLYCLLLLVGERLEKRLDSNLQDFEMMLLIVARLRRSHALDRVRCDKLSVSFCLLSLVC